MLFYLMSLPSGDQVVMVRGGVVSFLPDDPANSDWQAYQEWLAEGNTPEPWPPAES